jgi:hypothetical protein
MSRLTPNWAINGSTNKDAAPMPPLWTPRPCAWASFLRPVSLQSGELVACGRAAIHPLDLIAPLAPAKTYSTGRMKGRQGLNASSSAATKQELNGVRNVNVGLNSIVTMEYDSVRPA